MSYDPKCEELASVFLEDHPDLNTPSFLKDLSQTIQDAIEDWLSWEESQLESKEKES